VERRCPGALALTALVFDSLPVLLDSAFDYFVIPCGGNVPHEMPSIVTQVLQEVNQIIPTGPKGSYISVPVRSTSCTHCRRRNSKYTASLEVQHSTSWRPGAEVRWGSPAVRLLRARAQIRRDGYSSVGRASRCRALPRPHELGAGEWMMRRSSGVDVVLTSRIQPTTRRTYKQYAHVGMTASNARTRPFAGGREEPGSGEPSIGQRKAQSSSPRG
jgi:hypothetical protein